MQVNIRDMGSILGLGRPLGEGRGNPLQYSCLENPRDRGAGQAVVHWVAKSQTRLKHKQAHTLNKVKEQITLLVP